MVNIIAIMMYFWHKTEDLCPSDSSGLLCGSSCLWCFVTMISAGTWSMSAWWLRQ